MRSVRIIYIIYAGKNIIIAFLASARAVRREVGLPFFSYYYSSRSTARGYRANTYSCTYLYKNILFTAAGGYMIAKLRTQAQSFGFQCISLFFFYIIYTKKPRNI